MAERAVIDRQQALKDGLSRYFTGKPCSRGHVVERYTHNKTCCECANQTANASKRKNRKKYIEHAKKWNKANPEKVREMQLKANRKNPGRRNFWTATYRSAKDLRTPPWLNAGHDLEFESVYAYCAGLRGAGLDYHVDHIVPLRGETVSGLHVPWNLQVILGSDNTRKGNRFNG
jgi:hypothetical protein